MYTGITMYVHTHAYIYIYMYRGRERQKGAKKIDECTHAHTDTQKVHTPGRAVSKHLKDGFLVLKRFCLSRAIWDDVAFLSRPMGSRISLWQMCENLKRKNLSVAALRRQTAFLLGWRFLCCAATKLPSVCLSTKLCRHPSQAGKQHAESTPAHKGSCTGRPHDNRCQIVACHCPKDRYDSHCD